MLLEKDERLNCLDLLFIATNIFISSCEPKGDYDYDQVFVLRIEMKSNKIRYLSALVAPRR